MAKFEKVFQTIDPRGKFLRFVVSPRGAKSFYMGKAAVPNSEKERLANGELSRRLTEQKEFFRKQAQKAGEWIHWDDVEETMSKVREELAAQAEAAQSAV